MVYTKEEHSTHDSMLNPMPDCEYCQIEIFRRNHRCFGAGSSTTPVLIKEVPSERVK